MMSFHENTRDEPYVTERHTSISINALHF